MLGGNWGEKRFQIIKPGMQLGQALDESVMRAESANPKPSVP